MPVFRSCAPHHAARATTVAAALGLFTLGACRDVPASPDSSTPPQEQQPAAAVSAADLPLRSAAARGPIADEYIVVLRDSVADPEAEASRLLKPHGGTRRFTYRGVFKGFAAHMSAKAATALARHPLVQSVEQDQVLTEDEVVQSPVAWGLDRIDQMNWPNDGQYRYTATAPTVIAYILDSGLQEDHPEWGARGWIVYNTIDKLYADCRGHGTHVAGVVGGTRYGVAKQVLLRAVKVLNCEGKTTTSAAVAGMDWVRRNGRQPSVVNLSFGGGYSATLNQAARNLWNAGFFVVAAAGNDNVDACTVSPASTPEIMTVAASTAGDYRASFSNYGRCIDLYAPGKDITSASTTSTNGVYRSGTSQAAPFVTGVAALYKSRYPNATPAEVASFLKALALRDRVLTNPAGTPNLLLYKGTL